MPKQTGKAFEIIADFSYVDMKYTKTPEKPLKDKNGNPIVYSARSMPGTKDFDYGFQEITWQIYLSESTGYSVSIQH